MEGDEGSAGGEGAAGGDFGRSADEVGGWRWERGRQPNPGRGHLPRKGKRRSKVPEYAGDVDSGPNTNLEVEL